MEEDKSNPNLNKKKTHYCQLCGLEEFCNRGKNHHIVPKRIGKKSTIKVWLCKGCHMILHKAEYMGLVKMPKSNEEHKEWKKEMIKISGKLK